MHHKKPKHGHWSKGLLVAMENPRQIVKSDDLMVAITDEYPKAKHHFLIMPKEDIQDLGKVTAKHAKLLQYLDEVGREIAASFNGETFRLGYHAAPSMQRLHLHVISDDMVSPCMKNKRHWNSFQTDFFMDSKDVCENLIKNGSVILPSPERCAEWLATPLKCHKCDFMPKNMPELKNHLPNHCQAEK